MLLMRDKDFSTKSYSFAAMPRPGFARDIYPIFMPFSGCPQRCLFCAQDIQSGCQADAVPNRLRAAEADLLALGAKGGAPLELAFFGGTFTALESGDLTACLDFAQSWIERGLISAWRCSTRPDALSPELLARMRRSGCATVELGVQSFQDSVLDASCRGYDGRAARQGCALVREAGLELGVQLMPGMPGQGQVQGQKGSLGQGMDKARLDVLECLDLAPACVRLYPCLVIEGTALAGAWRLGAYRPWALKETLDFLAWACRLLEGAGIAVIRMGLAEEPGLAQKVLAGPRHPALGGLVRALALFRYIEEQLRAWRQGQTLGEGEGRNRVEDELPDGGHEDLRLRAPHRVQGLFWGQGAELAARYASLGLGRGRVVFEDRDDFMFFRP